MSFSTVAAAQGVLLVRPRETFKSSILQETGCDVIQRNKACCTEVKGDLSQKGAAVTGDAQPMVALQRKALAATLHRCTMALKKQMPGCLPAYDMLLQQQQQQQQ